MRWEVIIPFGSTALTAFIKELSYLTSHLILITSMWRRQHRWWSYHCTEERAEDSGGWGIAVWHRAGMSTWDFSQILWANSTYCTLLKWAATKICTPESCLPDNRKEKGIISPLPITRCFNNLRMPCFAFVSGSHQLLPELCSHFLGPFRLSVFHRLRLKVWWEVTSLSGCTGWHPLLLKSSGAPFKSKRLKHEMK